MSVTPEQFNVGPTGASCLPYREPGGEYSLEKNSCLEGTALLSGRSSSGSTCVSGIRLPEDGQTLAPWVALTFEGTGSTITVGNDSSPNTDPINIAVIQSFEFGHSDGLTMRCTIHDEEGGSFVTFMQHILKDYTCLEGASPRTVRIKCQFGWCKSDNSNSPVTRSRCYYFLSDAVETNFSNGKIIFEITGKDSCSRMFEGGCSQNYGGDGINGMPINEAIQLMMTKGCAPNVSSVRFCRMENGKCQPCGWKDGTNSGNSAFSTSDKLNGPKGKWECKGFNKLDVVLNWLKGHPTDRDKGWVPQYNCEVEGGELIFWEDSKPIKPEDDKYWDQNCIGVFIVNGGKRSNVIEFNPKVRWDYSRLTSNGGQLDSSKLLAINRPGSRLPGSPEYGLDANNNKCAGHRTQAVPSETHKDLGTNTQGAVDGINAQHRALKILHDNIEADLTIVGDPTLLPPSEAMWSKNCTIIMIDPYFLRFANLVEATPRLEWLAKPLCNEVLSSKAWICKSVTHRIESGKYTTTIGVFLTAGGVDSAKGSPLGNWTGGWTPPPQC